MLHPKNQLRIDKNIGNHKNNKDKTTTQVPK